MRLFRPHVRIESVLELSAARLESLGLSALLLDVDGTLKDYHATAAAAGVREWLEGLKGCGVGMCLLSNGRAGRIGAFARSVDLPFVAFARKPFPVGARAALRRFGWQASRTGLVGDQVFADVMAGRLAGMMSILVRPTTPEEPLVTRVKRPLERWLLRRMRPEIDNLAECCESGVATKSKDIM